MISLSKSSSHSCKIIPSSLYLVERLVGLTWVQVPHLALKGKYMKDKVCNPEVWPRQKLITYAQKIIGLSDTYIPLTIMSIGLCERIPTAHTREELVLIVKNYFEKNGEKKLQDII